MDSDLHSVETDHIHQGMNALMNDFNNYQVETDRKIAELEKQLNLKIGSTYREHDKLRKELQNAVNKESYLAPEDAKLINEFINKLKKELSDSN